jgi:acyl-CoA dehydrogenase
MKSLIFTEEHDLFRDSFRRFLKKEALPNFEEWEEKGRTPKSFYKKAGDMGFLGLHCPEDCGGLDLDYSYAMIVSEELGSAGISGVATGLAVHQYLALTYLKNTDSEHIKENYIRPSIAGDIIGSLGMSEPGAGSDLANIKTVAKKEGNYYIIDGSKTFISNGFYGDYMVTAVKTDPEAGLGGISMVVIDLNAEGVTRSKLKKLGLHSSDTAEIGLSNVKVHVENLVGQEGMGFYYMMQNLVIERMIIVWGCVTGAEASIVQTLAYMKERKAFGRPIDKFQALRHRMVDLATEVESCKAFTYMTTYKHLKGENVSKECAMLKIQATELLNKVVNECLQMHGGYGYIEEYPLARAYRDARIQNLFGGTTEVMREIVSKMVIDGVTY